MEKQDSAADYRIEDYLDHVFAPLVSAIPFRRRKEMRAEMRTHLLARTEAYRELGSESDEALRLTLKQFGEPDLVAERWLEETNASDGLAAGVSSRRADRLAYTVFGTYLVVFAGLWLSIGKNAQGPTTALVEAIVLFGGPFLSGCVVGLFSRVRPMAATLRAVALMMIPYMAVLWWANPGAATGVGPVQLLFFFAQVAAVEAMLGCLGTLAGEMVRKTVRFVLRRRVAA